MFHYCVFTDMWLYTVPLTITLTHLLLILFIHINSLLSAFISPIYVITYHFSQLCLFFQDFYTILSLSLPGPESDPLYMGKHTIIFFESRLLNLSSDLQFIHFQLISFYFYLLKIQSAYTQCLLSISLLMDIKENKMCICHWGLFQWKK